MSVVAGDCYEAAANYLMDHVLGIGVVNPNHNLRLVHGEVAGQGPLEGTTFGHAWVEDGDTVIDRSQSRDIRMPKFLYYRIGRINELNNIQVYTPEEARAKLLETKGLRPWDLEGCHPNFVSGPKWTEAC